jgi:hypothetical protein
MIDLPNSRPRGVLVLQTVARRRGAAFAVTEVRTPHAEHRSYRTPDET